MIEKEVKILEIDKNAVKRRLRQLGAKKIFEGVLHSRGYVLGRRIRGEPFVRVRQAPGRITLTYKGRNTRSAIHAKEELEVEVNQFTKTCKILERLGFHCYLEVEKHRTEYVLGQVKVALDSVPRLPPFIEIEAPNAVGIYQMARRLSYSKNDCRAWGLMQVYRHYGLTPPPVRRLR